MGALRSAYLGYYVFAGHERQGLMKEGLHAAVRDAFGPPLQPAADLKLGIAQGRYHLRVDQMTSALTMTAGSAIASMTLVLEGHKTWRDAGSDIAELTLVALGLPPDEARAIATVELPLLAAV